MAVYPAQLTVEEKNLKKRYAKLLEKRKQLRQLQEKPSSQQKASTAKPASNDALSPKDAMAAAKKLLEAGRLKLGKKAPQKKTGFKRVGETPSDTPPPKKAAISSVQTESKEQQQLQFLKQKKVAISYQKTLYKNFVKGSSSDLERIPKKAEDRETAPSSVKARTVFVDCQSHPSLSEEVLNKAFSRFGSVEKLELRTSRKSAYLTYQRESSAVKAVSEMNKGMVRGYEVLVRPAGEGNDFVELSEEAAANPWAVIAAGKEMSGKGSSHKKVHSYRTQMSYDDTDF